VLTDFTNRRSWFRPLALAVILVVAACTAAPAQEEPSDEYEIRAAMIFNMTKFVDWPNWRMADAGGKFVVCELGTDPVTPSLENTFRGKVIFGRQAAMHRLAKTESAGGCHILYVAVSERKRFAELAPQLGKDAVFSVGYQDWFTSSGGLVSLPTVDDRVHIQINLGAARQQGFTVSSKLLRLATIVQ
jgi:hypothetical protein